MRVETGWVTSGSFKRAWAVVQEDDDDEGDDDQGEGKERGGEEGRANKALRAKRLLR